MSVLAGIPPTLHQKRLNTLAPFAKTSLRPTNKANNFTGQPFLIHSMRSGAKTSVRIALVKSGVVGSQSGIRKGRILLHPSLIRLRGFAPLIRGIVLLRSRLWYTIWSQELILMNVLPWSGEGLFDSFPARILSYTIFNPSGSYFKRRDPSNLFFHTSSVSFSYAILSPNHNPSLHLPTFSFPQRHASQRICHWYRDRGFLERQGKIQPSQ